MLKTRARAATRCELSGLLAGAQEVGSVLGASSVVEADDEKGREYRGAGQKEDGRPAQPTPLRTELIIVVAGDASGHWAPSSTAVVVAAITAATAGASA